MLVNMQQLPRMLFRTCPSKNCVCKSVRLIRAQGLNGRAREIAQALCAGWPDKKIAAELGIGYSTVRTHVDGWFERFGVHNRTELVRRLLGAGRPH